MEKIELIIKIVMALCTIFVVPYLNKWLNAKVGEVKAKEIVDTIGRLCESAEQLLWESSGEDRLNYVMENLVKMEIDVNDEIRAMIESKVYELHK